MAYSLYPATPDDAEEITSILRGAFADDHIMHYWYLNVPKEVVFQRDLGLIKDWIAQGEVWGARLTKLVENETGKILGFARWTYPIILSPDQAKAKQEFESKRPPHPEGANSALMDEFYGRLFAARRKYVDQEKMFHLRVLCVHPDYQRRGIGRILIAEGLGAADAVGATTFIEASNKGYALYKSLGWEDIDEMAVDLVPHGGDHVAKQMLMMRQPRVVKGFQE